MEKEVWKDVVGFEGLYQVSNFGRVRSCERLVNSKSNSKRKCGGKIRANCFDGHYYHVGLHRDGKSKIMFVHRMVATAFINNIENKPTINHKDGNKLNNNVNNLEWVTFSENTRHAYRTGLCKPTISHYRGVFAFRVNDNSFVGEYKSQHEAAKKLGLNVAHICSVLKGRATHTMGYYFKYSEKEKIQNRIY